MDVRLNYAYGLDHHERRKAEKEKITHTSHISLRLDEFVEVWFDIGKPLLDTAFDVATAFLDVSNESSRKTEVSICLAEDAKIKQV